jgi:methyltransferase (TIGR00027 family)
MNDAGASRTALAAALMRAVHTRLDRPLIIDDPWGDRLVSPAEREALRQRVLRRVDAERRNRLEAFDSDQTMLDAALRTQFTYGGVIIRSRCAEDALAAAVARGARQYVLIGAGFDSFIVRQPVFARDLDIFEIDHPPTQALKRRRLNECGVAIPPNVHFVPADLSQESLASALERSAFSHTVAAFFSWLGVTVYLSREANLATLRAIATSAAPGSEVVFTYIDQRVLDSSRSSAALERMRAAVAAQGEPWLSGFHPAQLADDLRQLGLLLVEDLGAPELHERYCAGRTDGLSPGGAGHIARARVTSGQNP